MDQVKIGKFIAELRHENKMTQESLGQKIGITNKTVSRWENGNYMPDVEMLRELSGIFHVSINELLCGERLGDSDFRRKADNNLVAVWKGSFSIKERSDFWKKKWLKEHIAFIIACVVFAGAVFIGACMTPAHWLMALCPLGWLALYGIIRNRMMIYVEDKVFPSPGDRLPVSR